MAFCIRRHDKLDYLGDSEDMAISVRVRNVFREHDVGTIVAAGLADIKLVRI